MNTLIVSYRVLFGEEIKWNRVRRILKKDLLSGSIYFLHIFQQQDDFDNFQQIEDGIADVTPVSPTPFMLGGQMHDLTQECIAKLQYNLSNNTNYAFYSLALQAQDYIQQTDYLNALLYSVIAFENAHAEFVEHIAELKADCENARKLAQNLLREAGISAIVRLTPFLFMEPESRPSEKTIKDVVSAIEIRNQLVHAKRNRDGNFKIDAHNSSTLLPLIEAVFNYINTIARQLPD